MIGLLSKVNIIDNSGGLEGKCIKILNPKSTKSGRKQRTAQTGDLILISLTKSLPAISSTAPRKGNIYKALIVRTKKESNKYTKNINTSREPIESTSQGIIENSKILKWNDFHYLKSRLENKSLNQTETKQHNKYELKLKMDTIKNSFDDNSIVLVKVNKNSLDYSPIGTRIKGPICKKIKNRKSCTKIISILT